MYMAATEFEDPKLLQELVEGGKVSLEEGHNEGYVKYLFELRSDTNSKSTFNRRHRLEVVFLYGNYRHIRIQCRSSLG